MALGTVFLRQFTGSFDLNNKEFSLAPSITSEAGTSIVKTHPTKKKDSLSTWEIFGIAAAGFLLLLIIIVIIVYFLTKDKRDKQEKNIDEMRQ